MIIAIFLGLALGAILGLVFDVTYPTEYAFYITMGLLAALDSLLGAARSHLEGRYSNLIFATGFVCNAVLAGALTYLGDRLGVPLYFAVIFVFGGRLFDNLAVIRRIAIERYVSKKNRRVKE